MEAKLNKKIDCHASSFKNKLLDYCREKQSENMTLDLSDLEIFVTETNNFRFTKTDFYKKPRSKTSVVDVDRCLARRANHTQCTRRKKDNMCFCGTHIKGTPYGVISNSNNHGQENFHSSEKISVFNQEINGINYFLDDHGNIYKTEDILKNEPKPEIIGKYHTKQIGTSTVYFRS